MAFYAGDISNKEINKKTNFETKIHKEHEVDITIDVGAISPKHSDCHYDVNLRLTRALMATTLAAYCETEFSVFQPIRCVEGIASTGICGLQWARNLDSEKIAVTINAPTQIAVKRVRENVELNQLTEKVTVTNKPPRSLLDENVFNFIHLECFCSAALYLDSALARLPRGGLLALSTNDDPALYCKTPEVAQRNYGGYLGKTTYSREMAARLILAAVARTAAKHSKAIRVLWCYTHKGLLSLVVQVDRGPSKANGCLKKLRHLIHCNICEDRAFFPDTNYVLAEPYALLDCKCQGKMPGKTALEIGPLWSGELFDPEFLNLMMQVREKLPWSGDVKDILDKMLEEAVCPSVTPQPAPQTSEPASKKAKLIQLFSSTPQAPPFYFNLHKHGPKTPKMLKADRVVVCLRNAGFRASRTHFDLEAVRTNASLDELTTILERGFLPHKEERNSADF